MDKPFPAYKGKDPYLFVCYAHEDADLVYPELAQLHEHGAHLWYDEGISAGSVWRAGIAEAIQGATKVLYYVSPASITSEHCTREIHYAIDRGIDVLPIYLSKIDLTAEMDLALSRVQALYRYDDNNYAEHLTRAVGLETKPSTLTVPAVQKSRGIWISIGFLILALVAGGFWYGLEGVDTDNSSDAAAGDPERSVASGASNEPQQKRVAVLDLVDLSPNGGFEWLAHGVSQELRQQLSSLDDFDMIPKVLVTNRNIGDLVGEVDLVIDGSLQSTGQEVEVKLNAIDLKAGTTLWSTTFAAQDADFLEIQKKLATDMTRLFDANIRATSGGWAPQNPDAQNAFLKFQYYSEGAIPEETVAYANEVLRIDPTWAEGWRVLAHNHLRSIPWTRDLSYLDQARDAIKQAKNISQDPAFTLDMEARIAGYYEGDFHRAETLLRQFEDVHDGGWDVVQLMLASGIIKESRDYYDKWLKLDPYNTLWDHLAVAEATLGNWSAAVAASKRCAYHAPPRSYNCYTGQISGLPHTNRDEARALLAEMIDTQQSVPVGSFTYLLNQRFIAQLSFNLAMVNGDSQQARQIALAYPAEVNPSFVGLLLLELGDPAAEGLLEQSLEHPEFERNYNAYAVSRVSPEVRQHPLFIRWQNALGFTKAWRLELCEKVNLWPPDEEIHCDPNDYK